MKNIVLIGPPGSGKSTIAKAVAKEGNLMYISTGDIAREMAETDKATKYNLDHGLMAPEDKMRDELRRVLYWCTYKDIPFILDGFPRDTDQYLWLRKKYPSCVYVMVDVDIEECKDRLFHRNREDDKISVIQERMDWYHDNTIPMIHMIGLIHKIQNGQCDYSSINKILRWAV